jgi:hypothetical protein
MENVAAMSLEQKLLRVMRKAAELLPAAAREHLLALISPAALGVMAVVVAVWAGSHFFGAGEIADLVLLIAGWAMIGRAAWTGSGKLAEFAVTTYHASTTADLDRAARDLADAINILGIDVVLGLLLKGKPNDTFKQPWKPNVRHPTFSEFASVMPRTGPFKMFRMEVVFTRSLDPLKGRTHPGTNVAKVGRTWFPTGRTLEQAIGDVKFVFYHERVHQRLNQFFSLFGRPGLYLKMSAYKRSFLLRYLEEVLGEAYATLRVGRRVDEQPVWFKFPFDETYEITLVQLGHEAAGILLGPVVVGGATFQVYFETNHGG